ncbi:MAG: hypothetical protein Rpha_1163 [Candidatus Ruthia sp. Apha_13_S6]|nr:hypothetical protein [Candidatus Ruthia sp. Apha_13_S6]
MLDLLTIFWPLEVPSVMIGSMFIVDLFVYRTTIVWFCCFNDKKALANCCWIFTKYLGVSY